MREGDGTRVLFFRGRGFGVYKVINCMKRGDTSPVLVSNLGGLRCENCSSTNVTISRGNGASIIGAGNHVGGLRRGLRRINNLSNAIKVNRAE